MIARRFRKSRCMLCTSLGRTRWSRKPLLKTATPRRRRRLGAC